MKDILDTKVFTMPKASQARVVAVRPTLPGGPGGGGGGGVVEGGTNEKCGGVGVGLTGGSGGGKGVAGELPSSMSIRSIPPLNLPEFINQCGNPGMNRRLPPPPSFPAPHPPSSSSSSGVQSHLPPSGLPPQPPSLPGQKRVSHHHPQNHPHHHHSPQPPSRVVMIHRDTQSQQSFSSSPQPSSSSSSRASSSTTTSSSASSSLCLRSSAQSSNPSSYYTRGLTQNLDTKPYLQQQQQQQEPPLQVGIQKLVLQQQQQQQQEIQRQLGIQKLVLQQQQQQHRLSGNIPCNEETAENEIRHQPSYSSLSKPPLSSDVILGFQRERIEAFPVCATSSSSIYATSSSPDDVFSKRNTPGNSSSTASCQSNVVGNHDNDRRDNNKLDENHDDEDDDDDDGTNPYQKLDFHLLTRHPFFRENSNNPGTAGLTSTSTGSRPFLSGGGGGSGSASSGGSNGGGGGGGGRIGGGSNSCHSSPVVGRRYQGDHHPPWRHENSKLRFSSPGHRHSLASSVLDASSLSSTSTSPRAFPVPRFRPSSWTPEARSQLRRPASLDSLSPESSFPGNGGLSGGGGGSRGGSGDSCGVVPSGGDSSNRQLVPRERERKLGEDDERDDHKEDDDARDDEDDDDDVKVDEKVLRAHVFSVTTNEPSSSLASSSPSHNFPGRKKRNLNSIENSKKNDNQINSSSPTSSFPPPSSSSLSLPPLPPLSSSSSPLFTRSPGQGRRGDSYSCERNLPKTGASTSQDQRQQQQQQQKQHHLRSLSLQRQIETTPRRFSHSTISSQGYATSRASAPDDNDIASHSERQPRYQNVDINGKIRSHRRSSSSSVSAAMTQSCHAGILDASGVNYLDRLSPEGRSCQSSCSDEEAEDSFTGANKDLTFSAASTTTTTTISSDGQKLKTNLPEHHPPRDNRNSAPNSGSDNNNHSIDSMMARILANSEMMDRELSHGLRNSSGQSNASSKKLTAEDINNANRPVDDNHAWQQHLQANNMTMQNENTHDASLKNKQMTLPSLKTQQQQLQQQPPSPVDKFLVKVYNEDGSSKTILAHEGTTVSHIIQSLISKNNKWQSINWSIVEIVPDWCVERLLEDSSLIIDTLGGWTMDSKNKLLFKTRWDKYDFFERPQNYILPPSSSNRSSATRDFDAQAKRVLVEDFFSSSSSSSLPDIEGCFHVRPDVVNGGKKSTSWKRNFFLTLRGNNLYFNAKQKPKNPSDLLLLTALDHASVYEGYGCGGSGVSTTNSTPGNAVNGVGEWRKKTKSPAEFGFALRFPAQGRKIDCEAFYSFATEDESVYRKWLTALRVAKYGKTFYDSFKTMTIQVAEKEAEMTGRTEGGGDENDGEEGDDPLTPPPEIPLPPISSISSNTSCSSSSSGTSSNYAAWSPMMMTLNRQRKTSFSGSSQCSSSTYSGSGSSTYSELNQPNSASSSSGCEADVDLSNSGSIVANGNQSAGFGNNNRIYWRPSSSVSSKTVNGDNNNAGLPFNHSSTTLSSYSSSGYCGSEETSSERGENLYAQLKFVANPDPACVTMATPQQQVCSAGASGNNGDHDQLGTNETNQRSLSSKSSSSSIASSQSQPSYSSSSSFPPPIPEVNQNPTGVSCDTTAGVTPTTTKVTSRISGPPTPSSSSSNAKAKIPLTIGVTRTLARTLPAGISTQNNNNKTNSQIPVARVTPRGKGDDDDDNDDDGEGEGGRRGILFREEVGEGSISSSCAASTMRRSNLGEKNKQLASDFSLLASSTRNEDYNDDDENDEDDQPRFIPPCMDSLGFVVGGSGGGIGDGNEMTMSKLEEQITVLSRDISSVLSECGEDDEAWPSAVGTTTTRRSIGRDGHPPQAGIDDDLDFDLASNLPPPPSYAAPTPSDGQGHVSLSGDQRTTTAPAGPSESSPSLSSNHNNQTNRLSVLSIEDLPPPPPMEELFIDPDLPLPPPPPPMPGGGSGGGVSPTNGGRFLLAGKTLKTSQTEFLRERNPFLVESDERSDEFALRPTASSSSGPNADVDSGNSNFSNHLHSISSSSSSKPPMRPLPHKISQLNHQALPPGKPSPSTSSSTTTAYNPYLPSGSPGLIRRRIAQTGAIPEANETETAAATLTRNYPIESCIDSNENQSRQQIGHSHYLASNERRLSNQSQSSCDSSNSSLHQPLYSSHSSLHHPNSAAHSSSPSPSPAKAKPPPPPRRSSLCKSDKNFI